MSLPYAIHNDEPIRRLSDDLLAQSNLVNEIAETLGNRALPPFVASVNGDWGQGKTSILRAVFERLTGHPPFESGAMPDAGHGNSSTDYLHVRVVWFEAWRYQHEKNPIVALLNEIRRQVGLLSRSLNFAKKELQIALESSLLSLDGLISIIGTLAGSPTPSTGGFVGTIQKTGETWEKQNLAYSLPSETIRELLNKTIVELLKTLAKAEGNDARRRAAGQEKSRLIIIIDDLDRCQPTTTYRFLEGIKVFLNLPSCSILLGTNRREVQRSVAVGLAIDSGLDNLKETFLGEEKLVRLGAEYHEKICSFAWDIPFPTILQAALFLDGLLEISLRGQTDPVVGHHFRTTLRQVLIWEPAQESPRLLPSNPRRIKALANSLLRFAHKFESNHDSNSYPTEDIPLVLVLASIAVFHPAIHRQLLANPRIIHDLRAKVRALWIPGEIREQDTEANRSSLNIDNLKLDPDAVRYADPQDSEVFRMAPILAEMLAPTEDQLNRYLSHVL